MKVEMGLLGQKKLRALSKRISTFRNFVMPSSASFSTRRYARFITDIYLYYKYLCSTHTHKRPLIINYSSPIQHTIPAFDLQYCYCTGPAGKLLPNIILGHCYWADCTQIAKSGILCFTSYYLCEKPLGRFCEATVISAVSTRNWY